MGIVGNSCPLAHFSQAYFATYNFIFEARGNACAPDSARNFFLKKSLFFGRVNQMKASRKIGLTLMGIFCTV